MIDSRKLAKKLSLAKSTLHPSFPNAFKSKLYLEIEGWDAVLKVDHDQRNPFSVERLRTCKKSIVRALGRISAVLVYRTAKGHHVRIFADRGPGGHVVPARTILRLQAMLGDDPTRQKFNRARVRRGEAGWNVLWNRKIRNGHLEMVETLSWTLTREARGVL